MKSRLRIFADTQPETPLEILTDRSAIAGRLAEFGLDMAHWEATTPLFPDATEAEVLEAYGADIFRMKIERDFPHVDVLRYSPDQNGEPVPRDRYYGEHTHADDEVRFVVEGAAVYFLHIGDKVLEVLCSAGDLLAVPRNVKHWFDPGQVPYLTMIRLFTDAGGWDAQFTGDRLIEKFPAFAGAGARDAA